MARLTGQRSRTLHAALVLGLVFGIIHVGEWHSLAQLPGRTLRLAVVNTPDILLTGLIPTSSNERDLGSPCRSARSRTNWRAAGWLTS